MHRRRPVVGTTGATNEVAANTFGAVPVGTWSFVVAIHDATTDVLKISVNNGAFDSVAHTTDIRDLDGVFRFNGHAPEAGVAFDGRLDSVVFAKKVFSADDLTWLYNAGFGRQCSEL